MQLQEPQIKMKVTKHSSGAFKVSLKAAKPALWVWLELDEHDAQFEDNFICMESGQETAVLVSAPPIKTIKSFKQALRVRSLLNTYSGHYC